MNNVVKVGVLKTGCIGMTSLLEFFLDERAERTDIDVSVIGSGAKIGLEQCRKAAELMVTQNVDLVLFVSPAQTAPGPTEVRRLLKASGVPSVVVSDGPTKKITDKMDEEGLGYIIVEADSMIGARREFLDPTEVAAYNSDVLRVLAFTGTINLLVEEIEKVISSIKAHEKVELPKIIANAEKAIERSGISNPYARAKAKAAFESAKQVSAIDVEACFKIQESATYIPLVAAGHELMRAAAKLVDAARETEKTNDAVYRKPHLNDGTLGSKKKLMDKPKKNPL